ncbi:MAG: hypothetical protein LH702_12625 [Phormidesmis sp. CAN_BIN44]|nr:hypothetical protein [Phormidesmis sp. CAN_BIN44]
MLSEMRSPKPTTKSDRIPAANRGEVIALLMTVKQGAIAIFLNNGSIFLSYM